VELEKLTKIISKSGSALRVLMRVIVLPDPGGPQRMNGLCSLSQEHRMSWCLRVSTVEMIKSASVTF
jgi:hypothetical protein